MAKKGATKKVHEMVEKLKDSFASYETVPQSIWEYLTDPVSPEHTSALAKGMPEGWNAFESENIAPFVDNLKTVLLAMGSDIECIQLGNEGGPVMYLWIPISSMTQATARALEHLLYNAASADEVDFLTVHPGSKIGDRHLILRMWWD